MSEAKPYDLENNTIFADGIIGPLLMIIDMNVDNFDIDRLRATLDKMHRTHSSIAAWPFPETVDKADELALKNDTFKAIVDLMEARKKFIDYAKNKPDITAGESVIKHLLG